MTQNQTNGVGSKDNIWIGKKGNLFFTFVLDINLLPYDLPLQSASIYFNYILKEILCDFGSKVFLKWPNDFYIDKKKIGGSVTNINSKLLFCGIGLNLYEVDKSFGKLDISIDINTLLEFFFKALEKYPLWKMVFSKYMIEFHKYDRFTTNINNKTISLKDTVLNNDGSLTIDNKKVFSLR
jgi:BirA family biotin operon repressor/biotin-[acetyl-CoA-carboxylase] ligase